jgi:radical SAM superfamily enzyme YgiQ (UPF0313 family)
VKVALVNPPRFRGVPVIREDRCEITDRGSVVPPYSLIQIASQLNHDVWVIDANGKNMGMNEVADALRKIEPDVVVIRFTPTTFDNDMKVAEVAKKLSSTTVGMCWTLIPFAHEILKTSPLDYYVVGDYEVCVSNLIDAIEVGENKMQGVAYLGDGEFIVDWSSPAFDYDSLPLPAYDMIAPLSNYYINTPHGSPFTIMYTSKGCPYSCIYCTVRRTKWKGRSAESILSELRILKKIYNVRTVSFFDEIFTFDRNRVVELCERILKEDIKLRWYCNTRVDKVDFELLRLMRRAGCRGISFGVESGSNEILKRAKKGATVEEAEEAVKNAKKAGIKTYLSFMFGLPGESWESVNETIEFVKRVKPNGAQFNIAVPYPGTELYEECVKRGYVGKIMNWRELYQHKAILRTEQMSKEELEKARLMAYRSMYFNPRWILSNALWVMREPEELPLAIKYYVKSLKNYFIHRMEHAH